MWEKIKVFFISGIITTINLLKSFFLFLHESIVDVIRYCFSDLEDQYVGCIALVIYILFFFAFLFIFNPIFKRVSDSLFHLLKIVLALILMLAVVSVLIC